ncbi:crosslink repair DNA glycosylase YcaQ family protein [Methylopila sp. M107]|uniref:winged helix-turn-helix domain-containing protein n=1 Tax=Methylopila sp. M107 TaxID=1101190 RepID=UPI0003643E39|nr:crosslink repair DNA glycosylase YcaQ family protein [Methylopila sp. M107]
MRPPVAIEASRARAAWLRAQRLDDSAPFGDGPEATRAAVAHLGYVQIDTINVVERSHHHILFTRIPNYRRADLEQAQSSDRSVFEYWTHALAYVPTEDFRIFARAMDATRADPKRLFDAETEPGAYAALLRRIRREGELTIRDFGDEPLVEKTHLWGSRKPSKAALRYGFFVGDLTISRRDGMLKAYDLANRHFGWRRRPKPATDAQYAAYLLARALRSQGIVSLDSIAYGDLKAKAGVLPLIENAVRRKRLVPVRLAGHDKVAHWAEPAVLEEAAPAPEAPRVHILSPFDPLVIQRRRLAAFFGHEHRFEAYVPAEKRVLGYFALPVLVGDEIVAALDLKTDRRARRLLVQKWTWLVEERAGLKAAIEQELARFERFQLA